MNDSNKFKVTVEQIPCGGQHVGVKPQSMKITHESGVYIYCPADISSITRSQHRTRAALQDGLEMALLSLGITF